MRIEDAKWIAPLLQGVAEGRVLQYRNLGGEWRDETTTIFFDDKEECYRLKPLVPEYRVGQYTERNGITFLCVRNTINETENIYHSARENDVANGNATWLTEWLPLEGYNNGEAE